MFSRGSGTAAAAVVGLVLAAVGPGCTSAAAGEPETGVTRPDPVRHSDALATVPLDGQIDAATEGLHEAAKSSAFASLIRAKEITLEQYTAVVRQRYLVLRAMDDLIAGATGPNAAEVRAIYTDEARLPLQLIQQDLADLGVAQVSISDAFPETAALLRQTARWAVQDPEAAAWMALGGFDITYAGIVNGGRGTGRVVQSNLHTPAVRHMLQPTGYDAYATALRATNVQWKCAAAAEGARAFYEATIAINNSAIFRKH